MTCLDHARNMHLFRPSLAGIWNTWTDPTSGEVFESYSMLTQNCDGHPLLSRFHKYEPDLPPDRQDKRTVVPLDVADLRTWLIGTVEEAKALIRLKPADVYDARPDGQLPAAQVDLI